MENRLLQKADLHIHTNHSDGSYTPLQDIQTCLFRNIYTLSITDHEVVTGCLEAMRLTTKCAAFKDVTVIPGIEITAELRGDLLKMIVLRQNVIC